MRSTTCQSTASHKSGYGVRHGALMPPKPRCVACLYLYEHVQCPISCYPTSFCPSTFPSVCRLDSLSLSFPPVIFQSLMLRLVALRSPNEETTNLPSFVWGKSTDEKQPMYDGISTKPPTPKATRVRICNYAFNMQPLVCLFCCLFVLLQLFHLCCFVEECWAFWDLCSLSPGIFRHHEYLTWNHSSICMVAS